MKIFHVLKLPHDFTHGISYRPSTPVDRVISHQFQRKWLKDQLDEQNFRLERSKNEQKLQTGKAFENKASRLRRTTGLEKIYTGCMPRIIWKFIYQKSQISLSINLRFH